MPATHWPWRRRCRGLTLFGSLLALGLVGVLAAGLSGVVERQIAEARERRAAAGIAVLARAAHDHVTDRFVDFLAGDAHQEITLEVLRTAGHLSPAVPATDTMGRGRRILLHRAETGALDLVVTQSVAEDDMAWPWRAAAGARPETGRIGTVAPGGTRLEGPEVDVDIAAFQAAFEGDPAPRALAAHVRLDRHAVFGDQLWRIAVAGFPEINRMESDLDMAGHAITNAGTIDARTLAVRDTIEIGGDLEVVGSLVVGEAVEVSGGGHFAGQVTALGATVAGEITARTLTARQSIRAGGLVTEGSVSAGTIGTSGALAVSGEATLGTLTATTVAAASITADTLAVTWIDAHQVNASGTLNAGEAGISELTVGRCTGC